jgi:Carboxypeptidase regulatory-like domain
VKAWATWSPLIAAGFGSLLFLAAPRPGVSAPQSESQQRLCSIKGTVTNAVAGDGLQKAYVRLEGKGGSYPTVTDSSGRFVVENIPPGTYSLVAERQGFIESRFGDAQGVRLEIQLTPGQILTDITIKLTPQAVISGRVVDEDGDIWTHSSVNLFHSSFEHGRRRLQGFTGNEVNDQGEFRLGQLPPGTYYLSAQPDSGWESRNHAPAKEPVPSRLLTWYPSSADSENSIAITVGPGDQVSGLEIRLRRGSVHVIRGTLVGGENIPEERGQFSQRYISANGSAAGANGQRGAIRSDGTFEIPNVPSGTYQIQVGQGFPSIHLGSLKVQLDDRDLEDVSVQLLPPRPLKGFIQHEEKGAANLSGLAVQVVPFLPGWIPPTFSREDGSFEFTLVGSERYRVGINAGPGHYLKQIRYGDAVSTDGTISLTGAIENLILVLSARGARVTGTVTGTGEPSNSAEQAKGTIATFQVVLLPKSVPGNARLATFDQNGTFSLSDIPPGTYTLFAFEGVPNGAWEDSAFMQEVSGSGTEIELIEGDVRSVDVPVLLKSKLAPILKKLGME